MRVFFALIALMAALTPRPSMATPIVADLSNYQINIDARFIGTRLFLFGSRNESGDIVVVVRGPDRRYTVRRKERIAGMWVNRRYVNFAEMPQFYSIASSKPLAKLEHTHLMQRLALGSDTLFAVEKASSRKLDTDLFKQALATDMEEQGVYNAPSTLNFVGDSLFKTTINFPDRIPKGNYHAEIYLLQNDNLVAAQSIPITVSKVGADAFISTLAHELPWLYGLLAIVVALTAGWSANRIFARMK